MSLARWVVILGLIWFPFRSFGFLEDSYEGLFFGTSFGSSTIQHSSLPKDVSLAEAALGTGYDYYFLSYLGVGLASRAAYDFQTESGTTTGGTYSGLYVSPVSGRIILDLGGLAVQAEYLPMSFYQVTKTTASGEELKWSGGSGYSILITSPWRIWGGNLGLGYRAQSFNQQTAGSTTSAVSDIKLVNYSLTWTMHDLFGGY